MSIYLANVIDGLTSFVVVWGGIAWGHRRTCDCRGCQIGRRNVASRFLPGVS